MFELTTAPQEAEMIDFGQQGKVLFRLPVLGSPGVPMGITSAFSQFYDKVQSGRKLTDLEVSSSWNLLIQTLADSYPDATRQLARLDEDQLRQVITHWVTVSGEQGGYNPKAP